MQAMSMYPTWVKLKSLTEKIVQHRQHFPLFNLSLKPRNNIFVSYDKCIWTFNILPIRKTKFINITLRKIPYFSLDRFLADYYTCSIFLLVDLRAKHDTIYISLRVYIWEILCVAQSNRQMSMSRHQSRSTSLLRSLLKFVPHKDTTAK